MEASWLANLRTTVQSALVLVLLLQVLVAFPTRVNRALPLEATTTDQGMELDEALDQRMLGVHLVETQPDGNLWELWADEAVAFKKIPEWEVRETKVVFFAKNGVQFTVTGQTGKIDTRTKDIDVRGNVVTTSSNGYRYRSIEVKFHAASRTLSSASEVDMEGPGTDSQSGLQVRGIGMRSDLKTGLMKILSDVRARRDIGSGRVASLRSDEAEFSSHSRKASFIGKVSMELNHMRVSGGRADFDYDPESQTIREIEVRQGARVSDLEKWATAENLKIDLEKDRYVLRGSPRVVQGGDELRGERIVIEDQGRRVRVEKVRARLEERTGEGSSL